MKNTFHTSPVNLPKIKLSREQINTLNLGFDYEIEKDPKQFINTLIVDTENAIRHLDIKIQNTFRYLATKKIKQITEENKYNTLHKRYQYNLKQIKILLEQINLTIAKADKCGTVVIIHKDTLKQKTDTFIQENQIIPLNKDPKDSFQKHNQQTMHRCNTITDKKQQKYLVQIQLWQPN